MACESYGEHRGSWKIHEYELQQLRGQTRKLGSSSHFGWIVTVVFTMSQEQSLVDVAGETRARFLCLSGWSEVVSRTKRSTQVNGCI